MSEIYPFSLFILTGVIWVATGIQSHRLFYNFRSRYPDIARQEIPFANDFMAHPSKFIYFFKKTSIPTLKADPEIWSLRKQVKVLCILSLAVPITGFVIMLCIALYSIFIKQ